MMVDDIDVDVVRSRVLAMGFKCESVDDALSRYANCARKRIELFKLDTAFIKVSMRIVDADGGHVWRD